MENRKWWGRSVGAALAVVVLVLGAARADVVQWQDMEGRTQTSMRAVVDWGDTVAGGGFVLTITPSPGAAQVAVPLSRLKAAAFESEDGTPGREFGVTLHSELGARSSFSKVRLLEFSDGVFRTEPFGDDKRTSFDGKEADSFQGTALSFSGGDLPSESSGSPVATPSTAAPIDSAKKTALLNMLKAAESGSDGSAATVYYDDGRTAEEASPEVLDPIDESHIVPEDGEAPTFVFDQRALLWIGWAAFQVLLSILLAVDAFRKSEVLLGMGNLACCFGVQMYYVWFKYDGPATGFVRLLVTAQTGAGFAIMIFAS